MDLPNDNFANVATDIATHLCHGRARIHNVTICPHRKYIFKCGIIETNVAKQGPLLVPHPLQYILHCVRKIGPRCGSTDDYVLSIGLCSYTSR